MEDGPFQPQVQRRKYTKMESLIRWKKLEFIRSTHNYVHHDLPGFLPECIAKQIQSRVDVILVWAKNKVY